MPITIPLGVLANMLFTAALWSEMPRLAIVLAVVVAIAGAALILGGERKLGARLVVAGSILFVPLGLIAVFGARKVLDEIVEEGFRNASGGNT